MTPAIRATVLVIALLAGATLTAALSIAMHEPAYGGEAQDFWREPAAPAVRERHAGRARMMKRRHRHIVEIETARAARPSSSDRVRVVGGRSAFSQAIVLRQLDADVDGDADSFDRRATVTLPPRLFVPPLTEPALPQLPLDDRPERNPNNNARRLVCIAVVAVAAIAGAALSARHVSRRGIEHVGL